MEKYFVSLFCFKSYPRAKYSPLTNQSASFMEAFPEIWKVKTINERLHDTFASKIFKKLFDPTIKRMFLLNSFRQNQYLCLMIQVHNNCFTESYDKFLCLMDKSYPPCFSWWNEVKTRRIQDRWRGHLV